MKEHCDSVPELCSWLPLERANGFTSDSGTGIPYFFNQGDDGGDGDEDFGDVDGDDDGDGDNDDDDEDQIIVEYSVDSGATYLTPHLTPHSGPCHLIYQPHHPHISWW